MPKIGVRGSLIQRFHRGYSRGGTNECWEWQKGRHGDGYGQISINGVVLYAHRLSYKVFKGYLSKHDVVMHTCDNPPCVNPNHLIKGTRKTNSDDKIKKGRDRKAVGSKNGRSKLTEDMESIRLPCL